MTSRTKRQVTLLAGTVLLLGSAVSARANYVFNFSSLTPSNSDQSSAIATYMDGVIGCANCVTVSGLTSSGTPTTGVAVDSTYSGDGHVVGTVSGSTVTPITLGNENPSTNNSGPANGTYNFLSNTTNNATQLSQGILITFTNGYSLTGTFSFNYEIFPDGTCPVLNAANCGGAAVGGIYPNQPDLDFAAKAGSTALVNTTFYGVTPGTTNGTSVHSTASGTGSQETAPQLIGTYSTTLNGATSLSFLDWPATIGVNDLKLVNTPEPRGGVFFLLGCLALAAVASAKLRRAQAKS